MENLARRFQEHVVMQDVGIITRVDNGIYTVESHSGMHEARQAVSCLITPQQSDKVLVAGDYAEGIYVLAVLERKGGRAQTVSFQGDVDFNVKGGRLSIASEKGMAFSSAGDINLASSELNIHSLKSEVHIHHLIFSGSFWVGQVEKIRMAVTAFDSFIERLTQRVKRSYRTVEEIDRLRAGRLDYLIDKLLSLRGKYAMLTAKEDVKIDAERIHMG
ncbi:MAG: DUF3540 domain-containing protein [Deltaproteobacteria bacterium]|nr:DUF3540 domain-containing protein [Deltaproteobacteria bacterium]